jgi:hypothetical protein
MKFGQFSIDDANGRVLAHSLRLPEGIFSKGHVLKDCDLARLKQAELRHATDARMNTDEEKTNSAGWGDSPSGPKKRRRAGSTSPRPSRYNRGRQSSGRQAQCHRSGDYLRLPGRPRNGWRRYDDREVQNHSAFGSLLDDRRGLRILAGESPMKMIYSNGCRGPADGDPDAADAI